MDPASCPEKFAKAISGPVRPVGGFGQKLHRRKVPGSPTLFQVAEGHFRGNFRQIGFATASLDKVERDIGQAGKPGGFQSTEPEPDKFCLIEIGNPAEKQNMLMWMPTVFP